MSLFVPCAALVFVVATTATASWSGQDGHVGAAERLVEQLDLADTDHAQGRGSVTWDGTVASHADCSGFIDHLLMHVDGHGTSGLQRWFGKARPTTDGYHDAIVEGRGVFRLSANAGGEVAGFAWSTLQVSRFVAPSAERVALGRFVAGHAP